MSVILSYGGSLTSGPCVRVNEQRMQKLREQMPAVLMVAGGPLIAVDPVSGELLCPFDDVQARRGWITRLGHVLQSLPGDKGKLDVKHSFLDGVYMRELFIPKGTLLVGKVHKLACMNLVTKGDISVLTETGSARVKAGYSVVSPAGIQKVGYAHEDTVFVNVFRTDETNPDLIEQAIAWDGDTLAIGG